ADEEAAVIAGPVGSKGDRRRGGDAHEQRRCRDDGDLARPQAGPVEPDRQIRRIGAGHEEEGGVHGRDAGGKPEPLGRGRIVVHAAWRRSWMMSANSVGSILPPESTAATVLPLTGTLPARMAASETAPPGSST